VLGAVSGLPWHNATGVQLRERHGGRKPPAVFDPLNAARLAFRGLFYIPGMLR